MNGKEYSTFFGGEVGEVPSRFTGKSPIREKKLCSILNLMEVGSSYILSPKDFNSSVTSYPETIQGCQVTPLINPPAYFRALAEAIERTGRNPKEEFIYIAGHLVNLVYPGDPFMLPTRSGRRPMVELLKEKARQGVDVRVISWISWSLGKAGKLDARPEIIDNFRTIQALREEPALEKKACLNIIGHPAGGTHAKMIVIGGLEWAAGFTGGIDLSPDRKCPDWQDVQAQVEGPGVQALYDFYKQMWDQNLYYVTSSLNKRRSNVFFNPFQGTRMVQFSMNDQVIQAAFPDTDPVPHRQLPTQPVGKQVVQSLRVIPQFNYAPSPFLPLLKVQPITFAPQGVFEVSSAIQKAISIAEKYVYIEDQYLWSIEVMRWIQTALIRNPSLLVILVTGESDQLEDRLEAYRVLAILDGLLPDLSREALMRVQLYQHERMIHSKTMIVDDAWALIGSANLARRSLYTDIEHAIAVSDKDGHFARQYRTELWGERLGFGKEDFERLADWKRAVNLWNSAWGKSWLGPRPGFSFRRIQLDPPPPRPAIDEEWYRLVEDPDSRVSWYFPLRKNYPGSM